MGLSRRGIDIAPYVIRSRSAPDELARLLYVEGVLVMTEGDEFGVLTIASRQPDHTQISRLTRTDPSKVEERLATLERAGLLVRRERDGAWHSPEMVLEVPHRLPRNRSERAMDLRTWMAEMAR